jgi:predicted MPP superfamily phosphohydrolase
MFDGAKVDIARTVEPWTDFHPPAGTYFVTGNHDEFGDPGPYLAALTKVGVRVLHNEKVTVEGLQIVGVNDSAAHRPALFRQMLEQAQIDPLQPSILLSHRPAHLEIAAKAGISLQLSGHTHAGQFPLWTFLVRRVYGRFAYGLNRLGSLQIVTSSGAGSGGPPLRVGTRSEIVVLRLEAAAEKAAGTLGGFAAEAQRRAEVGSN